jgi:hypothetical protein
MKLAFEIIHCYEKLTSSEQSFQKIGNWPRKKAMQQQMDGGERKSRQIQKTCQMKENCLIESNVGENPPKCSQNISSESLRKELLECRVEKRWMRGRRTQHKTQLRTRTRRSFTDRYRTWIPGLFVATVTTERPNP